MHALVSTMFVFDVDFAERLLAGGDEESSGTDKGRCRAEYEAKVT